MSVAPDGSPVEVWLRFRVHDQDRIIDEAVPSGGAILELGCGVGRVTQALVARGRRVVAVDESAAMLEHVKGAERVCSTIESLALEERFSGVVLASRLINVADARARDLRLRACARHLRDDGVALFERWSPEHARTWRVGDAREIDGVEIVPQSIERDGTKMRVALAMIVEGREWVQRFEVVILDDEAYFDVLSLAGLEHRRWLDAAKTWGLATHARRA
jgi:SAM-dependent methyltransferase